jgi:ribonuclease P protein component
VPILPHLSQDAFAKTLNERLKISIQCFSQTHRLRKSFEFQRIKQFGHKRRNHAFWMQAVTDANSLVPKLGIIVTRKFGNAVVRNHAKRIFREIFRRNLDKIPSNFQIIILPRKPMHDLAFNELESCFMVSLQKLSLKL